MEKYIRLFCDIIDRLYEKGIVKIKIAASDTISIYVENNKLKGAFYQGKAESELEVSDIISVIIDSILRNLKIEIVNSSLTKGKKSLFAVNELYQMLDSAFSTEGIYISYLVLFEATKRQEKINQKIKKAFSFKSKYEIEDIKEFLSQKIKEFFNKYIKECETQGKKVNIIPNNEENSNGRSSTYFENTLQKLGIHYTVLTQKEYIENPAIASENEIKQLAIALLTEEKSAMLVGPPGVGKTSIVEGLAYLIQKGESPKALKNKKIIQISTASLVSGCSLMGMLEEKIEELMKCLEKSPDVILFIDEGHTLIGAGRGMYDTNDVANMLKPYLDRGRIKMITCTTTEEYIEYVNGKPALARRFIKVDVAEKEPEKIKEILARIIPKKEKGYNIKWFSDSNLSHYIISTIVDCTKKEHRDFRVSENSNPDLSITIIDYAFAHAKHEDRTEIAIEDIIESIDNTTFIYQSVRKRYIQKLKSLLQNKEQRTLKRKKIISFPQSSIRQQPNKIVDFVP